MSYYQHISLFSSIFSKWIPSTTTQYCVHLHRKKWMLQIYTYCFRFSIIVVLFIFLEIFWSATDPSYCCVASTRGTCYIFINCSFLSCVVFPPLLPYICSLHFRGADSRHWIDRIYYIVTMFLFFYYCSKCALFNK